MLNADFGRISAAPRWDARNLDAEERRRRLGSSHPHPFRGRTDAGAQRQRRERAGLGARPEGRLPPTAGRHRHAHHAVPRLRGHFMEHCHNTGTKTTRCCCAGTSIGRATPTLVRLRRRSRRRRASTSSTPTTCCRRRRRRDDQRVHWRRALVTRSPSWRRAAIGARAVALARRLLSERPVDDAGGRARALLRPDQGPDRGDRVDLHELPVRLSARDRASRPGAGAARRAHGQGHLLLRSASTRRTTRRR